MPLVVFLRGYFSTLGNDDKHDSLTFGKHILEQEHSLLSIHFRLVDP